MVENKELKIIECKYGEREDIIKFLFKLHQKSLDLQIGEIILNIN